LLAGKQLLSLVTTIAAVAERAIGHCSDLVSGNALD
jgi:hypothetical protein